MKPHYRFLPVILLGSLPLTAHPQPIAWQQAPGPYGGWVCSIAERADGILFAGTNGDGMYLSTDAGTTWARCGSPHLHVWCLAADSLGGILAGTPTGLYRSTDTGRSWERYSLTTYFAIAAIAVDSGSWIFVASDYGMMRSTNAGAEWEEVCQYSARTLALGPNGSMFAGAQGILRSTDRGDNWEWVYVPGPAPILSPETTVVSIAVGSAGELYAGSNYCLLRSTDGGTSWASCASGSVNALVISASGEVVASIDTSVLRSTDNGASWAESGAGLSKNKITNFCLTQANDIFAGTVSKGIFRSLDHGHTWIESNRGLSNVLVGSVLIEGADRLLVGTSYGSGIYRSLDGGLNWTEVLHVGSVFFNQSLVGPMAAVPGGEMLVSTTTPSGGEFSYYLSTIYHSEDDGSSWQRSYLPEGKWVKSLLLRSGGRAFAGSTSGLYRSTDGGETWITNEPVFLGSEVRCLLETARGMIYAGTSSGLYVSFDTGLTWSRQNASVQFRVLACDSEGRLHAGGFPASMYSSSDDGRTWRATQSLPSDIRVHTILVVSDGRIFIGTGSHGVFRSADAGSTWDACNDGLRPAPVFSLAMDSHGWLYAGTWGSGLFRTTMPITSVSEKDWVGTIPEFLGQNYPNPFNPITTIRYALPIHSHVTLTVFNTLGQQVATVVEGEQEAGYHEVRFDGSGLASGVYFYRLQARDYVQTRTFVLLQ